MTKAWWLGALAVFVAWSVAGAQERDLPSPYFECPFINYFDSGCPELESEEASTRPQAPPAAEQPAAAGEQDEDAWQEENPELLAPLFPKESLSRDTPELYRALLTAPTLENARRFVRWYSRRMESVARAQALIALAGRELLSRQSAKERRP
ncbi:MAG: hypothetical protein OXP66_05820 [Candidatus Tectomicrobia bacterium]|nr:hypothetical protein [Candidatus Tectomicrobia bacterium]